MNRTQEKQAAFGLPTAITMIVGVVVGSGIFFKSDDILRESGGNFTIGLLILILGAMGIIFGTLTLSELALKDSGSGGAISYFKNTYGDAPASGFGLFQTFVYYPTVAVVVAHVAGIYTFMLLGRESTLEQQMLLGLFYTALLMGLNTFFRKGGAGFQNLSTVVKLIPLFFIAFAGIFSSPISGQSLSPSGSVSSWHWLAGLAPMAFSFDGWIVATAIAPEVKNPKKNMPLALVMAPLFILLCYVLYFSGVVSLLGEEPLMEMGDRAVNTISVSLLGERGGAMMMAVIVVSVLGVVNGLCLGGIRLPQAMGEKGMVFSSKTARIHEKYQISLRSAGIYALILLFWFSVHYLTMKFDLLKGRDVSEIAIVFAYITYVFLYVKVFQMGRRKETSHRFRGLISPIPASLMVVFMVVGALMSSPVFVPLFLLFDGIIFYLGSRWVKGVPG